MIQSQTHAASKPVRYLKGIGPKRSEALERLGIKTIYDLCFFLPRQYQDRSNFAQIADIRPNTYVTLKGKVSAVTWRPMKRIGVLELWLQDKSGAILAIWFNQPFLKKNFQEGAELILSGKAEVYKNRLQIVSPEYEIVDAQDDDTVHTGRITPIYPLSEGLFQRSVRLAMKELVDHHLAEEVSDYMPDAIKKEHKLLNLIEAVRELHFPSEFDALKKAQDRIIFDDFFLFELQLLKKMQQIKEKYKSASIPFSESDLEQFEKTLPFRLTQGQRKAIQEIGAEIASPMPMSRLLQGEVGSGKTVVAAFFFQLAAKCKIQSAFLIPTEVLAEQHEATLKKTLEQYPVRVELLTASVDDQKRGEILRDLQLGKVDVLVGTHAMLQESVSFRKLGFVVIDEQHKFGVRQRAQLLSRDPRPHLLVMSATPIPRTLGLTLYGDLSISTIRELPKNRKPIKTEWMPEARRTDVYKQVKTRIAKGEQAYMMFPIIEETERLDLQAASQEFEKLKRGEFKDFRLGLIHGRMSKDERNKAMSDFKSGKLHMLVSTSVIEVGVDNPNATMMIIQHADRFGLSQLHQIRGRIGRGELESICFLIADPKTENAKIRLEALVKTNNGFEIAEEDLKLRGPGEFFGLRQSGAPMFRLADITRDYQVLETTRESAKRVLKSDPSLSREDHRLLARELIKQYGGGSAQE